MTRTSGFVMIALVAGLTIGFFARDLKPEARLRSDARAKDLAAIERLHKADVEVTLPQDPSALTELFSDGAANLVFPTPAIGKNLRARIASVRARTGSKVDDASRPNRQQYIRQRSPHFGCRMARRQGQDCNLMRLPAARGGGMGEVYGARDTRLECTVATKILRAQFFADLVRKQRFRGPFFGAV
jgi:hypothetical protein